MDELTFLHTPFSSCSQFRGLARLKMQVSPLGIMREQWRKHNVTYSPRESHDVNYIYSGLRFIGSLNEDMDELTFLHTPFSSCSQFRGLARLKMQVSPLGIMREQWRKHNVTYSPRESHDVNYIILIIIICNANSTARLTCSNSSGKYTRYPNKSPRLPWELTQTKTAESMCG